MRKVTVLTAIASIVLGILIGYFACSLSTYGRRTGAPSEKDAAAIAKARSWKAKREGVAIDVIARLTQPSVISFSKTTCVQLKPASGVAGGRTVICFDNASGALASVEEIGE